MLYISFSNSIAKISFKIILNVHNILDILGGNLEMSHSESWESLF